MLGVSVSSTMSTACTVVMSEMVMSWVPALFIVPTTVTSPALILKVVTVPSIGERTVVLDRSSREALSTARLCSIWCTAVW